FGLLLAPSPAGAFTILGKAKPAPMPGPSEDLEVADVQSLLHEAKALWYIKRDYTGALAKFNAAVDADPKDNEARLQRGYFFEVLSGLVLPDGRAEFKARAQDDYQAISDAGSDSLVAGMARDGLTRLAGEEFLEPTPVACPETAIEVHARGDSLYGARRFADA